MNTAYIVVTANTTDIRATMDGYNGTELVASQETFICWHWVNPAEADLAAAQALSGYKGTVQLS